MNAPAVHPLRRAVAGVACAALLAGTGACTGDSDQPAPAESPLPDASTGAASTLDAKPVPMKARVVRVGGDLSKGDRAALERAVGRTVGAYFDDAYLGGTYPRENFSKAFSTFTDGAAQRAHRDRAFLTNATLGRSTQAVVPRRKQAWLSALSPRKAVAGVTAQIRLAYVADREDAQDIRVTISGRLLLTRSKAGRWRIFGYDVSREARPLATKGATR